MPLKKGKSQRVISENIEELENSKTKAGKGRSHKENVAIAYSEARKSGLKDKGYSKSSTKKGK